MKLLAETHRGHNFLYLNYVWAFPPAILVLVNILSGAKLVELAPFTWLGIPPVVLAGGTVLFPITYVLDDLITEVYGFTYAKRIIWTCFAALLISFLAVVYIGSLPAPSFMSQAEAAAQQEAYNLVLGMVPRVNFASVIAVLFGRFVNSGVMALMKAWSGDKLLKSRFVISTLAGEAVDTALFLTIAFYGTQAPAALLALCISQYVFKVLWEIAALPFTTFAVRWLKRVEGVD